jgi:hypothetical protein
MQIEKTTATALREGVKSAYPGVGDLRILVSDILGIKLQDIIALNNPIPQIVFDIFEWCESQGRLLEFLLGAAKNNPGNPKLKTAMAQLRTLPNSGQQLSLEGWKQLGAINGEEGLEKVVLETVPFQDIASWLDNLAKIRRRVCRVEPQTENKEGYGTGFLIAPDVVMTNYHVIKKFLEQGADKVCLRFDYEVGLDGASVSKGTEVKLAADWHLLSSSILELDFALIRLADKVGAEPRGFLKLKGNHLFAVGEPLIILQHPAARPLQLAMGSVTNLNPKADRVAYNTNTEPGSSGSPCLNASLEAVAIHHFGTEDQNRGVRFNSILSFLRSRSSELNSLGLGGVLA